MGEGGGEARDGGSGVAAAAPSRKEKRKERKKMKRKQARREAAEREREEEERRMNDPEEQKRAKEAEEAERERAEAERRAFEERERVWMEEMERKRREREEAEKEEEERRRKEEEERKRLQVERGDQCEEDDNWEYVEEGPAEIIWQGNEIIVRKKKIRVPKKNSGQCHREEDADRPTSNPLPPQSDAFAEYQIASSAQQILENVAQQVPNFGTEQDKAHCPFHLKTGACRFGQRCSRVHFYPDKSCTLLIKNMYNGPGIAWEQDEGLEYTDEEVERCYEEFYEDVHTEFLKYGELVNFKVCKNGSFHLRGNVYAHYKSVDSAVLAYNAINGRFFAGKQVKCEFVNLTRWKVAICGEYMRSRLQTCSHGVACNFIHCFRNPGGDYEWADWDKPAPRYWVKKMIALFGYPGESEYEKQMENEKSDSSKRRRADTERHRSRSKSHVMDQSIRKSSRSGLGEENVQKTPRDWRHMENSPAQHRIDDDMFCENGYKRKDHHRVESRTSGSESDCGWSPREAHGGRERSKHHSQLRKSSRYSRESADISTDSGEKRTGICLLDSELSDGGDGDRIGSIKGRSADADTASDQHLYGVKHRRKHRLEKKKSSRYQESESTNDVSDDRHRRHGSNSSDDQFIRERENYYSPRMMRPRSNASDDGDATPKRSKRKSDSSKFETEKSGYRCKPDDSDSRYSCIEEIVEQDRWRPESPEDLSDKISEPVDSGEDYHHSKRMREQYPHRSTSCDRNSTEFCVDSRSRSRSYQSNKKQSRRNEPATSSHGHRGVDDDNRNHRSKHQSRSRT